MPVLPTGTFTFLIPTEDLAKGLRPTRSNPRNAKFLTECNGAVGIDNVLQVLKDMNLDHLIDVSTLTYSFPYPQLFVFTNMILVCTQTKIYEYTHSSPGTLTLKITVAPGILWSAVDFYDYIYISNCVVAVVRHTENGSWEEVTNLPAARAMCNFNGQVVISPCTESVVPTPAPPDEEEEGVICLGVNQITVDPVTLLVSGRGHGAGATSWEMVKLSDESVVDSGTGNEAFFSFYGELGASYELRFT